MAVGGPSKIGTIDPNDTKVRVVVDADLNEVKPGSEESAFIFRRSALDALKARRAELGVGGDEARRVQDASTAASLADAERRLAAAEADVQELKGRIAENKASAKADAKAAKDEA